jgi:miniconductance mechanosensitive channel
MELILEWLSRFDLSQETAVLLAKGLLVAAALIIALFADITARKILNKFIGRLVEKTKNSWDNIIFQRGIFRHLGHIAPLLILYAATGIIFPEENPLIALLQRLLQAWMIVIILMVINALLSSVQEIYQSFEISKKRPIKGYLQIIKIFLFIIGAILIVTTILNTSPVGLLSGIGALSAIILLVFRDSILGLVASIQLSANNMIRIGDWIEMPSYGVDGDIIDVTLQTVTVQNWDKTIATIPIYALISSSFRNWRGMQESGGRRIKRSINIDMNSIRFCDAELTERLRKFRLIHDYLETKEKEIAEYNRSHDIDEKKEYFNGRRMTNIGTFRAYISAYLHSLPLVRDDMTFLVRHLAPTEHGLPMEIYVFCADQRWAYYEALQADIFDHLLAVLPLFDLSIYQAPGSRDIRLLSELVRKEKS